MMVCKLMAFSWKSMVMFMNLGGKYCELEAEPLTSDFTALKQEPLA